MTTYTLQPTDLIKPGDIIIFDDLATDFVCNEMVGEPAEAFLLQKGIKAIIRELGC